MYLIGIDIGTGSTKAIATDVSGKVLATSRVAYPTLFPKANYSEQEPAVICRAFKGCIKTIIEEMKRLPEAICLSSAMHSVIPIDANGKPLMNMMTWADNRGAEIAHTIRKSKEGKSLYETGGTAIHAMSPLSKIMWLKENDHVLFNKTFKFISIKEYVWHHLFNQYEIDYSLASATGLFDIMNLRWNEVALNYCGILRDRLSTPVNTSTIRKNVRKELHAELGVTSDVAFVIGASDGCLANLGSFAIQPGVAALTIGTSGAIRLARKVPVLNYDTMPFNYRLDENTFISGGPVNNGGVALKWYAESFLKRKLAIPADYDSLLEKLTEMPAGCEGLVFLPYILGERAPIWDSDACGVFFGITARHQQAHFTRAVLEGISMALFQVSKTLESADQSIDIIHVSGGFVHNLSWLQLLADIFGKKIGLINAEDASALGAIFLGMKALGIISSYHSLDPGDVRIFYPHDRDHQVYTKTVFPRYQRLYQLLRGEMQLRGR